MGKHPFPFGKTLRKIFIFKKLFTISLEYTFIKLKAISSRVLYIGGYVGHKLMEV